VGLAIGAFVATLPISGTTALVLAGVGVAATGYSAYKTHSDYKSGKISQEERDERYGELAGEFAGGAAGGSAARGLKSAGTALAEQVAVRELAVAGIGKLPPPRLPTPPRPIAATPSTALPATAEAGAGVGVAGVVVAAAVAAKPTGGGSTGPPKQAPDETPASGEKPAKVDVKSTSKKPDGVGKPAALANLRLPSAQTAKAIREEGALTEMANKLKGLGDQAKGVTIEIVLARTKDGKEILVAGINSGAKGGFNKAQLALLEAWGVNVAPQQALGMKHSPHAEENIAAFLQALGARGLRWSRGVVGAIKPGGSSYVCQACQKVIRLVGGRVEQPR
jgi:hypothetical protein